MAGSPSLLYVFNESSGITAPDQTANGNDGTIVTANNPSGAIENTDFSWNQGLGSFDGFVTLNHAGGTDNDMPWIHIGGWSQADNTEPMSVCVGFSLVSLASTPAWIIAHGSGAQDNGLYVWAVAPSGAGDFNLQLRFELNGFGPVTQVVADLSFGTVYKVSVTGKRDASNTHIGWSVDGSTAVAVTGSQFNGTLSADFYIARNDFTNTRGVNGDIAYVAYWRNEELLTADLEGFSSDPTTIPDWPSAGGGGSNLLQKMMQMNQFNGGSL